MAKPTVAPASPVNGRRVVRAPVFVDDEPGTSRRDRPRHRRGERRPPNGNPTGGDPGMMSARPTACTHVMKHALALAIAVGLAQACVAAHAQEAKIAKTDVQIDGLDPGIKLFIREKMAEGNTTFTDTNVVLFLHGATAP